jgi:hypothetical protein
MVSLQSHELINSEGSFDSPVLPLSHWVGVGKRMSPNLSLWLLASSIAAGGMLLVVPVQTSWAVVVAAGLLLLTPLVFWLGWVLGLVTFNQSRARWPSCVKPHVWLVCVVPILLCSIAALGFLGGGYWWLLSFVIAFLGHRKGTQRAWWGAVANLAWVLRNSDTPLLARTDAEAISLAIDSIKAEIGRRPLAGAKG